MTRKSHTIPICDYEGSDYRTRFWENRGREYEDLAERIAIRRLLPSRGQRLLEVGAGFGRLSDMYAGYEEVVLLDYSRSMLREAQMRLGRDSRYTYLAADLYRMPLANAQVDAVSMVRVIHHIADVPAALGQIWRVLCPGGVLVLEFASKFHLKSILRYLLHRQEWSPFDPSPVEFVALNFDFHPRWMRDRLEEQGFVVERVRAVSHFRLPLLKRVFPPRFLAALDGVIQGIGKWCPCAPSIFVLARRPGTLPDRLSPLRLRCPACGHGEWPAADTDMRCPACGARWRVDGGLYDLKDGFSEGA